MQTLPALPRGGSSPKASQTSDNVDRLRAEIGRVREEKRREEERGSKRESLRRKKIQVREKVGKSKHYVCPIICAKSKLAKAAGAEPAGQMRDEKLHAVVARSTFPSQNVQNTSALEHFWKLRCRKSAHPCGAKHISKSKCPKHFSLGALLEVEMSKKCTAWWREAHFQVKMYTKHTMLGPILEVEMSKKCTPLWREAHVEVKMYKTPHVRATFGR